MAAEVADPGLLPGYRSADFAVGRAAGVHPEMIQQILGLLRQLREQGKLVIFIEHDIAAVRQVADVVVVMDEGRVIAQGAPGEVLERPEIMEAYLA